MGARLVSQMIVFAVDVPLHPNEYRLLNVMALRALDDADPPRYFDSREASSLALGRRVPDDPESPERLAAFEAVKVATRGLVALRAIERIQAGHRGRRAEFAIRLNLALTQDTDEYRRRKAHPSPSRKAQPSPKRRLTLPQSEGPPFPQGTTEEPPGTRTGNTSPSSTTSLGAFDIDFENDPFFRDREEVLAKKREAKGAA
jgi:hypothetical protein